MGRSASIAKQALENGIKAKLAYLKPFHDGSFVSQKIDYWELRNTLVYVPYSKDHKMVKNELF